MLLKIRGDELEIVPGKFVCLALNEGETSYFSEWNELDRELREKFETIREGLLKVMENFINSKDSADFEAVSEEYKEEEDWSSCPAAKASESEIYTEDTLAPSA